jgi:hypothetical protein
MNRRTAGWMGVATAALLTACVGSPPASGAPGRSGGADVLTPDAANMGRTILYLIQTRLPNVQVRRSSSCPDLEFRGRRSLQGATPPVIYVQGQRTSNTCVLETLSMADVERVEVYRMGRGYHSGGFAGGAGGTILIFLKDGASP